MTHPEDLLADYVDGTLTEKERAAVDVHLSSCEACREEVALASQATTALTSLPEEPVPFGVTGPVLAQARKGAERRQPVWARLQWAVGLAAAASLILVVALLLPRMDGGSRESSAERAPAVGVGGSEGFAGSGPPPLETIDQDFDEAGVKALAKEASALAKAPSAPTSAPVDAAVTGPSSEEAIACLRTSGAPLGEDHVLVRVIDARYLGTPVTIGVFLEGPGSGQPAEQAVVWIVKRSDCSIVTIASQLIH